MNNSKTATVTFIQKAQSVHGDKYNYNKVIFRGVHTPVTITCPTHGDFSQRPVKHTSQRCGCPACGRNQANQRMSHTLEQFITKSIEVHGNTYSYDKVVYVNNYTAVNIVCPTHGDFYQRPVKHTVQRAGCPRCSGVRNTEDFILEAHKIHKHKYDYSCSKYVTSSSPVAITCPTHGLFSQTPNHHLQGYGCTLCGHEALGGRYCESTLNGTSLGSTPGMIYFIKLMCITTHDTFYKIGITKGSISDRWSGAKHQVDVLAAQCGTLFEVYTLEQEIIHQHQQHRYVPPSLRGNGHTECFKLDDTSIDTIKDTLMDP